jgi:hypothetical protein
MTGLLEVLVRVLSGRRIATSNVTADEAFAQLHPSLAGFQALRTSIIAGLDIRIRQFHVLATRHQTLPWE